jgi:predicted phosphoadenosine phosphosulfate sulfurtransferase
MDDEMINRCIDALENKFKTMIEFHSGQTFAETGVKLPNRNNWKEYAECVIKTMREPTEKMRAYGCVGFKEGDWQCFIDAILND